MTSNYRRIGDFIRLVDIRNNQLKVDTLLGLSITKEFIPSVANTVGTNMEKYKIIKKGQFACSLMQVRRDKKIPVALQYDFDEAIISQAYPVFEVADENQLNPEYLMMWMTRSEFDRHACFLAVGGVRGSLEWDDFCDMELPVPSIEKQRESVREYNVINDRITLNENLTKKIENTAQTIYKQWFVDFEFPISKEYAESIGEPELEGMPYQSSGGEMKYCEELQLDIPNIFNYSSLGELINYKKGNAFKSADYLKDGIKIVKVSNFHGKTIHSNEYQCVDESRESEFEKYKLSQGDVLISTVGSWPNNPASIVGQVVKVPKNLDGSFLNQNVVKLRAKNGAFQNTLMLSLSRKEFSDYVISGAQGSANQASVTLDHLFAYQIILGDKNISLKFSRVAGSFDAHRSNIEDESISLLRTKNILLKRLSKA